MLLKEVLSASAPILETSLLIKYTIDTKVSSATL